MEDREQVVERRRGNQSLVVEVEAEAQKTYQKLEMGVVEDRVNEKVRMKKGGGESRIMKLQVFQGVPLQTSTNILSQLNRASLEQLDIDHPVPITPTPPRVT